MADGRAMGTYSSDDQMRLLTGDINGWLARNEGAKGSKIVGAVDKIISSPFQAMAGPDALTILGGIADKHDGFSFGVDLGSRNYARGIHYGSEIDDGIQIASIPLLLNPKNATGLLRGVRALEVGGELSMFRRISGVRAALPAESRVFWSGGDPAREAAEAFAMRTSGATTLELSNPSLQTISETMLTQGKDWATVVRPTVWEPASEAFAEGASGTINVFQNAEGVSLRSVWREIEYPILKENPGIKIQYHVVMPDGTVISIQ
jgi:hypothetical protein